MKKPDNSIEDQNLDAPERLIVALRQSKPEPIFVPPTLDETILRAAREHLTGRERPRFRWLPVLPWLATTAAVVVAGAFLFVHSKSNRSLPNGQGFAREDVNHDGRVDVLDAFALARQLKEGRSSNTRLDLNGDGIVDERDVHIIALEAVKLDKGGHS
jgi:hypothetical protein